MSKTETPKTLVEALSRLQTVMEQPKKGVENTYFKSRYADLTVCFAAVKPHLAELGLAFTQEPQITASSAIVLRSTLRHVSGEVITSDYPVNPIKGDPQALGSAMTYARRYALNAMFGIAPEGEDDDGNAASQPTKAKEPTPEQKARAAADKYIERIDLAKTVQEADAVKDDLNKGKMNSLFPEYYAEVVEEHKAKVYQLERKAAKESK